MKLKAAIRKWRNKDHYKRCTEIHWFVWLIENPKSPVSLTGAVDLHNHDIIHILLDRDMDVRDEAMVIGFTMGNSEMTSSWVRWLFEFCAKYLYPKGYRFDEKDLLEYERGFAYGYSRPKRNIHTENFVTSKHVGSIRREWSIKTSEVL
tara:strand:- start:2258 stop:2704 length:447 start_codon:yes stop_codon:yes gene_type:complete